MSRKHVWRLVVDSWPTNDGQPFVDQGEHWWQDAIDRWGNPGLYDDDPFPWVPGLAEYVPDDSPHSSWGPPPFTRIIGQGDYGSILIAAPRSDTRRFFTRKAPAAMRDQLIAWGCTAHIERAEVGEWEVQP